MRAFSSFSFGHRTLGQQSILVGLLASALALTSAVACRSRSDDHGNNPLGNPAAAAKVTPKTSQNAEQDDLGLSGATGRHLQLLVSGLREGRSKAAEHRICGIALNGLEAPWGANKQPSADRPQMVCTAQRDSKGVATLELRDVPYPAYVFVFHDENLNGVLDFATFDIIIAKKTGPTEGVGVLNFDEKDPWPFSRPLWVEQGLESRGAKIHYGALPFESLVKETAWSLFFGLYLDWARDLNNPGNADSPTNNPGRTQP